MSTNFLTQSRHRSIYYFRRRIPNDLKHNFSHNILLKSLKTTCKRHAVILARSLASQADRIFEHIRNMKNKNKEDDLVGISYGFELHFDEYKQPILKVTDAKDEDTESITKVVTAALNASNNRQHSEVLEQPIGASKRHHKRFQDYVELYWAKADLKPNTIANYKSKLEDARQFFGENSNPLTINQVEIVKYSDHVKQRIENTTTQGLYIQVVVSFVNWHRIREGLGILTSSTLIPTRVTPQHEDREEFSNDDMRIIFKNAFKYSRREPHKWWVTIAAAFLGCRIEELCQVNIKTDLLHDQAHNIWYFNFNESPDSDGSQKKSLKKMTSWRKVPIHSALVKHGFIDYLKSQSVKGATRPFELNWSARVVEADGIHKWSHYITKWAGRELAKLAEDVQVVKGKKTYFHSMRHTFARLMQDAGVSGEISEALAGRNAGVGEQERYGKIKNNYVLLSKEGIERGLRPLEDILESVFNSR
ncbi:DUF6538 domain-containing protein [Methylophilus flavus]|uniref:DUF6538 domain-containing protein n=1 Tax=Methylophilus flavus TaxID=640084 RepID=A0ABW3PDY8_9PROT